MERNEQLYERNARAYVRHSQLNPMNAGYERPAMYALLGEVGGARVLDAGCAGGAYSTHLAALGAQVIAVDCSAAMVEIVRSDCAQGIDARKHDLGEPMTWLGDGVIDLVVSSLTLHYLRAWDVPLKEFFRVLRPGGRLLFSTHHPAMTAPLASSYFDTVLVRDIWDVCAERYQVHFYHRPLQAILSSVLGARFQLTALHEPQLQHVPEQPWFLIVEAVRPV
ncbi:MAG TPA: class I SAM-dependent methyltransferase [Candidatus Baltobacteraceae bacterium]|nr:class I SAM-dependent methyltransferase [Candidatus Baltobacteraceae bacterium]